MVVLYFFDIDSKPSQEGLLSLSQMAKQFTRSRSDGLGYHPFSQRKGCEFCVRE